MAEQSKKQTEQHIIDAEGQKLLRQRLPPHWILREYRPDYGLDFALEIFAGPTHSRLQPTSYETLGEHLFIQLKSIRRAKASRLRVYPRFNVEKQREALRKNEPANVLETIPFPLDTTELITVERMGVGVPVLLVVADLATERCHFVCLNDYIDKILVPRHDDYRAAATRTIHVPLLNEVGEREPGRAALRWYAKRPKLYAAFQRFVFQANELNHEWNSPDGPRMAKYFASRIASYDFWDDTEMWGLIGYYGSIVRRFLQTGEPGLIAYNKQNVLEWAKMAGDPDRVEETLASLKASEVPELWRLLSVLPSNYEDVCREWFLPTDLGYHCSYAGWNTGGIVDRREEAG